MNILTNGDIVYPERGEPPQLIEGYVRDSGNPYVLILQYVTCQHRKSFQQRFPCGRCKLINYCNILEQEINAQICKNCPIEDK